MRELRRARYYVAAKERRDGSDPTQTPGAVEHMRETVPRRLSQLLLARFLLLRLLVEEAKKLPTGLQEKGHRRLWVLLQVQPAILDSGSRQDVFTRLSQLLQPAPLKMLEE
jgi:hypothetical protein